MRLIVDDFLEVVPRSQLAACVACVGAFGAQSRDMNVSLTAVGMLWSVVDFVSSSNAIATSPAQPQRYYPLEAEGRNGRSAGAAASSSRPMSSRKTRSSNP